MNTFVGGAYLFVTINLVITALLVLGKLKLRVSNLLLSLYLFVHAVIFILYIFLHCGWLLPEFFYISCLPAGMVGPLVFFYTRSLLPGNEMLFNGRYYLHFLPALSIFVLLSIFDPLPFLGLSRQDVSATLVSGIGDFPWYLDFFIYLHVPAYYLYTVFSLRRMSEPPQAFVAAYRHARQLMTSLCIFLLSFYFYVLIRKVGANMLPGTLVAAPFVLFLMFVFFLMKAFNNSLFFHIDAVSSDPVMGNDSITNNGIAEELEKQMAELLYAYLHIQKVYKDKELNLNKLSGLLGVSSRSLSHYINLRYGKNLNDHINGFRVEEAKQLLVEPQFENLKLEAIGEMAGFSSRASFFSNFKKYAGETPASFRRRSGKDHEGGMIPS